MHALRVSTLGGVWVGLLLSVSFLSAALAQPPPSNRPNFVVILLDDLRADALGCTGHPFVRTPHLDRLAASGARFTSAFATTPLCVPSRASFLTGQYPHAHGVKVATSANIPLSHRLITFPQLLQAAGYETAFIGKWHIGNTAEPRPGFDRWVSFEGQGVYVDPELNRDGKVEKRQGYTTDLLTDEAVTFITSPHPRPFLTYLSHKAVHAPFVPASRHREAFAHVRIPRPSSETDKPSDKPVLSRPGVWMDPKDTDTYTSEQNVRDQLACLLAVDDGVGRVLEALERTGQRQNTVVIFSSDHGYFWGEHGLGGKHGPYEEALRIPLLVSYPAMVRPGLKPAGFALSIDLAPTLLDLAGVAIPSWIQGRSLVPVLRNEQTRVRTRFLAEFFLGETTDATPRFPDWQAVRDERWKFVRYSGLPGMEELYDLKTDPQERKNLATDRAHAAQVASLVRSLEELLAERPEPAVRRDR
jgi:N-acetylglucosamine-6-sulfatase